jgi:FAD synthetase
MKRVMVFGTFDLLHEGHRFVLQEAKKRGSLTVVVARSSNVERIKGRKPEQSDRERVTIVMAAAPEATVILGTENDFLAPVREVQPDLIVLGYDQRLPPGITETDLAPAMIERLPAYRPEEFKSSLLRKQKRSTMP